MKCKEKKLTVSISEMVNAAKELSLTSVFSEDWSEPEWYTLYAACCMMYATRCMLIYIFFERYRIHVAIDILECVYFSLLMYTGTSLELFGPFFTYI